MSAWLAWTVLGLVAGAVVLGVVLTGLWAWRVGSHTDRVIIAGALPVVALVSWAAVTVMRP